MSRYKQPHNVAHLQHALRAAMKSNSSMRLCAVEGNPAQMAQELDLHAKIDYTLTVDGPVPCVLGVAVRAQPNYLYDTITLRDTELPALRLAASYGGLAPRLHCQAYDDWRTIHVVDLRRLLELVTAGALTGERIDNTDGTTFTSYALTDMRNAWLATWQAQTHV
jgi:hypothetical protein